jgi:aminomethyltransferase
VGKDLRKVATSDEASGVFNAAGKAIGRVLTCATDMGIGWTDGMIKSIASPDKPADFRPRGLCCGFVLVDRPIPVGETVELRDARRRIEVTIMNDIRPDRTARKPMRQMFSKEDENERDQ